MDSQRDAGKQVEEIVSPALLPQEWELEHVKNFFDPRFAFMDSEWLPRNGIPLESEQQDPTFESMDSKGPHLVPQSSERLSEGENKKPRLSLSLRKKKGGKKGYEDGSILKESTNSYRRFGFPTSENELSKAAKGVVPTNTMSNTRWAENNFVTWARERNKCVPDDPVPLDLLRSQDANLVNKNLCRFILETRREDGNPYPPGTLRSLLSALNRIMQANKAPFSIYDKRDLRFRDLMKTMDSVSSELHRQGIGAQRKHASVITQDDETMLWEQRRLGDTSPRLLQHTVFVYCGLQFCLRGIQEQYDMTPNQLIRVPTDKMVYNEQVYYKYVEYISKNNQHKFKDINSKNKEVKVYALVDNPRCLVKLLDQYLERLPADAPYLYMRPLEQIPRDSKKPWYTRQRVGFNTLKGFVNKIFSGTGVECDYTNHSLRATAITRMFTSKVPEKIIAEKSGHRSLEALRSYEHTSLEQDRAAGRAIISDERFPSDERVPSDERCPSDEKCPCPSDDQVTSMKSNMNPQMDADTKAEKAVKTALPTFSGKMENCTINFHFSN